MHSRYDVDYTVFSPKAGAWIEQHTVIMRATGERPISRAEIKKRIAKQVAERTPDDAKPPEIAIQRISQTRMHS